MAASLYSHRWFSTEEGKVGRHLIKHSQRAAMGLLLCTASSSLQAESAFDGFRLGLEAIHSETSFHIDARKPKEAALRQAQAGIARGEADLASAASLLSEQRTVLAAGSRSLAEARQRLAGLEQRAAVSPPEIATAMSPAITQLRMQIAQGTGSLQARSAAIAEAARSVEAGRLRLSAGNQLAAEVSAVRGISTVTLSGESVRFSLGWGTSLDMGVGRLHLGAELDAAPGTGRAMARLPARSDMHLEGGASFGGAVRVGWIPVRWAMPYVTAGVETQELRMEGSTTRSTWHLTGFRAGVGIELSLSDKNIVRVGYDCTILPDVTFGGVRVTPSRDTYRIGYVRLI